MTFSHFKKPHLKSNTKKSNWDDVINSLPSNNTNQPNSKCTRNYDLGRRYFLQSVYSGQCLTAKQRNILLEFLQHKTTRRIALDNNLSERTVEDYSKTLRDKFDCINRKALVEKLNTQEFLLQILDM